MLLSTKELSCSINGLENEQLHMGESHSNSAIWGEIELSESYLVSSMYEKAASSASSVIERIRQNGFISTEATEVYDMIESAGMVFVQSLNQLGSGAEILKELKSLFVSAEAIPVQVLLTGACFQIAEDSSGRVIEFVEEFLRKWSYVDGRYYALVGKEEGMDFKQEYTWGCGLEVDSYMEVVELYTMAILGKTLKDLDMAISWVEKASLPEERRQVLLRKLYSLYSLKASNGPQVSVLSEDGHENSSSKDLKFSEDYLKVLKANHGSIVENGTKNSMMKLSGQINPCFSWFRSIKLKIGNARLVITNGKIALWCLVFLVYYVLRRKRATLKGTVSRQIFSIKKGLVDLWQLAFSYQVNPLAAVQPLAGASHGSR